MGATNRINTTQKVICGLEYCSEGCKGAWEDGNGCPYMWDFIADSIDNSEYTGRCVDKLCRDALSVVKSAEQVRWERDVALEQLRSIGKELGEQMEDIKALLGRKGDAINDAD